MPTTAIVGSLSDFQAEYRDAVADFDWPLPEGAEIPAEASGDWEPDANYEEGLGEITVAFYAQCAWLREYATSTELGANERAAQALARLREWIELPAVVAHVDDQSREQWASSVIGPAEEGDDAALQSFAADCT